MTRLTEAQLLEFCTRQRGAFAAEQWHQFVEADRVELATAALFLASVDWFGEKQALRQVAAELLAGQRAQLSELVSETGFDCSRFSNLLRRKLEEDVGATS